MDIVNVNFVSVSENKHSWFQKHWYWHISHQGPWKRLFTSSYNLHIPPVDLKKVILGTCSSPIHLPLPML